MKVIFLDIDGVLNSEEFFVERTQNCRYDAYRSAGYSAKMSRNLCSLDSVAIANLNHLITQTGAKIVPIVHYIKDPTLTTPKEDNPFHTVVDNPLKSLLHPHRWLS